MQCVQQDPSTKAKTDADVGDARSQKTHRYVLPQGTVAIFEFISDKSQIWGQAFLTTAFFEPKFPNHIELRQICPSISFIKFRDE
ncbi:hypothetical protein [Ensifer canadensis]